MDFEGYLLDVTIDIPEDKRMVYPFNVPGIKDFTKLDFHPHVTYFVGENQMGKSTLLEAIAVYCGFNAEGGSKNFNFATRESHSELHRHIHITKGTSWMKDGFFLRSESFYNVASTVDDLNEGGPPEGFLSNYGGKSLHERSHGESFWKLMTHRFRGRGLYLMDEPESALSAVRQMAMLSRIENLVQRQSQLIIATHSPIVLAYPDSIIYEFSETGIKEVKYRETETYTIFKEFINDPDKMLSILLNREL
jgi:predicted ATPase